MVPENVSPSIKIEQEEDSGEQQQYMQETLRLEQNLQDMSPTKKAENHKEIVLQKTASQRDAEEIASDNFKLQSVGITHNKSPLSKTN